MRGMVVVNMINMVDWHNALRERNNTMMRDRSDRATRTRGKRWQACVLTDTSFEDAPGSLARYSVFDTELRDANSIGQGPKPVQLGRLRLRLVPHKELGDGWLGLPIARMTALRSDGSATLDADLIPPVNGFGASDRLTQWLTQIHGTAKLRGDALAQRLSGTDGKAAEAAEVTDYLLLQIINRYEPQLEHLFIFPENSAADSPTAPTSWP